MFCLILIALSKDKSIDSNRRTFQSFYARLIFYKTIIIYNRLNNVNHLMFRALFSDVTHLPFRNVHMNMLYAETTARERRGVDKIIHLSHINYKDFNE